MSVNILLSYPGTGSHLVRFFIELLTEKPTCPYGPYIKKNIDIPIYKLDENKVIPFNIKTHKNNRNDFIYHKTHTVDKNRLENNLIVLLRSPKESILRNSAFNKNMFNSKKNYYLQLYNHYLSFKGKKLLLFYEDTLTNKKEFIEKLYIFLASTSAISYSQKNQDKLKYCLDNVDKLYNFSFTGKLILEKKVCGNKCISKNKLDFYYNQTNKYNKEEFNIFLKKSFHKYNFLMEKYNI